MEADSEDADRPAPVTDQEGGGYSLQAETTIDDGYEKTRPVDVAPWGRTWVDSLV